MIEMDPTAVMGRRIAAFLIDILLVFIATSLVVAALGEPDDAESAALIGLVPFGLFHLSGWLVQGITGGTPGKLLVRLRVIDRETGSLANYTQTWNRTVLWLVDGAFVFVGLLTSLVSKGHRRIGDMVAKTLVVDQSDVGRPPFVPGLTAPVEVPMVEASVGVPRWDPGRNAYILWSESEQSWLQLDGEAREWKSI